MKKLIILFITALSMYLMSCQKYSLNEDKTTLHQYSHAYQPPVPPDTINSPAKLRVHFKKSDLTIKKHGVEFTYDSHQPGNCIDIYSADTTIEFSVIGNTKNISKWIVFTFVMPYPILDYYSKTIFCPTYQTTDLEIVY